MTEKNGHRLTRSDTACYFANTCALAIMIIVPVWVPILPDRAGVPLWVAGGLASLLLGFIACSNVVGSVVLGRFGARNLGVGASFCLAGGLALMTSRSVTMVVLGCALAGVGAGMVLTTVYGVLSRRTDPQRQFAAMTSIHVLFSSLLLLAAPPAVSAFGLGTVLLSLSAIVLFAALMLLRNVTAEARPVQSASLFDLPDKARGAMCAFGLISISMSHNALWSYSFVFGENAGFTGTSIGRLLSVGFIAGFLAPLLAHQLAKGIGPVGVILLGVALIAVDAVLLSTGRDQLFVAGVIGLPVLLVFTLPSAIAVLTFLDARWAEIAPFFLMLGSAIGPLLGALMLELLPGEYLGATAALGVLIGGAALALGGRGRNAMRPERSAAS